MSAASSNYGEFATISAEAGPARVRPTRRELKSLEFEGIGSWASLQAWQREAQRVLGEAMS